MYVSRSKRPAEPMELRLCDFDEVQYNLTIDGSTLSVSMQYPPYRELERYVCYLHSSKATVSLTRRRFGAKQWLESNYNGITIASTPKSSYDLTLQVNLDQVGPEDKATLKVIENLSALKRNVLGAPLDQCFAALKGSTSAQLSPIQIPYRKHEKIYIQPQADRIVVVYSVCFDDTTDQAIARVFLQEYAEAGRRVNNAPPISFGRDPPLELRNVPGLKANSDHVGYLSVAVFPSHVDTDAKKASAISMIQGFRNYLHYHIKTTKSYLHSRMRTRVDLLLHVLNRAHPEKDPSKVSKKTISGKTFTRA